MTFASNVAPRRRVRQQKRAAWTCDCPKDQPAAIRRCLDCLEVRPS